MTRQETAPDHYAILGVRSSASPEEIRRRYKFLVIAFHPDRFLRTPDHHALAEQRIKQVNEAYRVLSDAQARTQYDMLRIAAFGGAEATSAPNSAAPFFAQMQHELEQVQARSVQLEQEIAGWRARYEAQTNEKQALQQDLSERERSHQHERLELEVELSALRRQLEQLARERIALDAQINEQENRAGRKVAQLQQKLAGQEQLVEKLTATKAEWERSNQSRFELLSQQVRKLQQDIARRDASLAQQQQKQSALGERLANVEHEARLSSQALTNALRVKQQEAEGLLQASQAAGEGRAREQRSVRLWQVATIIAILNTLLLLVLLLVR